jgi:hypothetical protein
MRVVVSDVGSSCNVQYFRDGMVSNYYQSRDYCYINYGTSTIRVQAGSDYDIFGTPINLMQEESYQYVVGDVIGAVGAVDNPDWTWDASRDESGNVKIPFVPDIESWTMVDQTL